jgi:hypothetical protein
LSIKKYTATVTEGPYTGLTATAATEDALGAALGNAIESRRKNEQIEAALPPFKVEGFTTMPRAPQKQAATVTEGRYAGLTGIGEIRESAVQDLAAKIKHYDSMLRIGASEITADRQALDAINAYSNGEPSPAPSRAILVAVAKGLVWLDQNLPGSSSNPFRAKVRAYLSMAAKQNRVAIIGTEPREGKDEDWAREAMAIGADVLIESNAQKCDRCGNFLSAQDKGHKPTCGQGSGALARPASTIGVANRVAALRQEGEASNEPQPSPTLLAQSAAPARSFSATAPEVRAFISQLYEHQARYAQQYAEYLARERDEPVKPRQVSDASAHSIRYRLDQMARAKPQPLTWAKATAPVIAEGNRGEASTQVAPTRLATPIAQPSSAASRVAAPAAPRSSAPDNGIGDNVVSRCDQCGQWKGPSHVCAKSETESALCRMEDKEWRAYQKTLKTPDGKPDHKALARAMHLRESGAEAALLGALADAGTGRLPTTELSDLPIPVAVANGALRRLLQKEMVSERDGDIALLSVAKSVEPGRAGLHPLTPLRGNYPSSLDTSAKRDLFKALGNNEQLALAMDAAIRRVKHDDWRGHVIKEREVQYAILECLDDDEALELANRIFELAKSQAEY